MPMAIASNMGELTMYVHDDQSTLIQYINTLFKMHIDIVLKNLLFERYLEALV